MRNRLVLSVTVALSLVSGVCAADVPAWAKESIRIGSPAYAALDVIGKVAPGDLAAAGLVWMQTEADFGPGTPGRSRLLLTLASAPNIKGEPYADDSVVNVLLRYWSDEELPVLALLHVLERASPAVRPAARERVRDFWMDGNGAVVSTALTTTARLGGVSTEQDLTMMKAMVERPEAVNPLAWADNGIAFRDSIPFNAAFVVLSSSMHLRESVEWAAGLKGEPREAARAGMLSQMLIEDGAFAQAAPDLRIRWLEVFDTMLREINDIEVRDFAMPLLVVMQRHPECTEQACRTLAYLRQHAEDPRLHDSMTQVIRDAGMGHLLTP